MSSQASSAPSTRVPITRLPISSKAPIYHLPPDPLFPTPQSLLQLSSYDPPEDFGASGQIALKVGVDATPPSMLRRSRQIRDGGCFTYVSPLPIEFPYDIQELGERVQDKQVGQETKAKAGTIETALAQIEISPQIVEDTESRTAFSSVVRQGAKFPKPNLLSVSHKCHQDWLPQLDIGEEGSEARRLLVDVLGGKTVIAKEGEPGFAPWSLAYAGHQFGSFAGQLGDGRAISLLSTPTTSDVQEKTGLSSLELQLKGAGRTPYSRFADGLAVLRSSVREYLGAEGMAALKLPTSRALALVGLPSVKVRREMVETAAIVTRVADSWIRIGNFELQRLREEWDSVLALSHFVGREVFSLDDSKSPEESPSLALAVVREASERNAKMIAGWQAYGFMHGVMNTDNIAMTGACIDYGPYAWMDVFDSNHICNHSDDLGRYSYKNQPTMGLFAINKLGVALAELIGAELEQGSSSNSGFMEAKKGWADEVDEKKMEEWREAGTKAVEVIKSDFVTIFMEEYKRLMRLRLGFTTSQQDDDFKLVSDLLDLMELHSLDFHSTIRLLSQFPQSTSSAVFSKYLDLILPSSNQQIPSTAKVDWKTWFGRYAKRLEAESTSVQERRRSMDQVNPRFILRQWVLEETIAKLEHQKPETMDLKQLDLVLKMSGDPFEAYGETEVKDDEVVACKVETEEQKEMRRLCGMGDKGFLGFQCSCSS